MNKTALIIGASGGIGSAVTRRLAGDGWDVIIHYNTSESTAKSLAQSLHARTVHADVTDPAQVAAMFRQTGSVGLLVYCAGVAQYELFSDTDEARWRYLTGVNLDGAYRCCREAIPDMVRRKAGNIILTSSVWGVYGAACEAAYSASKAALIGLTKALAKELGPSGIRVNCVAPGVIETPMLSQFSQADKAALAEDTPLGRLGQPKDVAELIAFLSSEKASFITGQTIGCDGGFGM